MSRWACGWVYRWACVYAYIDACVCVDTEISVGGEGGQRHAKRKGEGGKVARTRKIQVAYSDLKS